MAQRKPYNLNTKYGRKKLKEQSIQEFKQLPKEEQNYQLVILFVIIAFFLLIVYFIGGSDAVMKWMQR